MVSVKGGDDCCHFERKLRVDLEALCTKTRPNGSWGGLGSFCGVSSGLESRVQLGPGRAPDGQNGRSSETLNSWLQGRELKSS